MSGVLHVSPLKSIWRAGKKLGDFQGAARTAAKSVVEQVSNVKNPAFNMYSRKSTTKTNPPTNRDQDSP